MDTKTDGQTVKQMDKWTYSTVADLTFTVLPLEASLDRHYDKLRNTGKWMTKCCPSIHNQFPGEGKREEERGGEGGSLPYEQLEDACF